MKFRTVVLALVAFCFVASLFAEEAAAPKTQIAGAGQYGAVTLDAIEGSGLVKLNGTSVLNNLHLTGSLVAQNAVIGSLDIMGEANLTETTVKNGGSIMGSLQAVRSIFLENIKILSQKAVFTSCRLEGITVQQDRSFKGKQIVELKQGTIINGPVHFESGKGEVIVFPGCQVLGVVTGGKIVKKS